MDVKCESCGLTGRINRGVERHYMKCPKCKSISKVVWTERGLVLKFDPLATDADWKKNVMPPRPRASLQRLESYPVHSGN